MATQTGQRKFMSEIKKKKQNQEVKALTILSLHSETDARPLKVFFYRLVVLVWQ